MRICSLKVKNTKKKSVNNSKNRVLAPQGVFFWFKCWLQDGCSKRRPYNSSSSSIKSDVYIGRCLRHPSYNSCFPGLHPLNQGFSMEA